MQPLVIYPEDADRFGNELAGAVITQEVRHDGKRRFRKGQRIAPADLDAIATLDAPIHAVRLAPHDVHEDDAARRLAALVAGDGLTIREPVQSRVNIAAAHKGLTRIDAEAVFTLNTLDSVAVFTVPDRLPVLPGKIIAGAKIATVAVPQSVLAEAEAYVASRPAPVLSVVPFLPHTAGVIVTEGLAPKLRDRFEGAVRDKLGWYGSALLRVDYVAEDAGAVVAAFERLLADGADLILTAGGNMMDPLDASLQAIPRLGGSVIRLGAPAHPGSMFWLGYTDRNVPIVNLASCSMYSRATVADLVLPWVMAGEQVTTDDLASLGYGGLLDRDMGWRFPDYEAEAADEPDER